MKTPEDILAVMFPITPIFRSFFLVLALSSLSLSASAQSIQNGGFETGSPDIGGPPLSFGPWKGDGAAYVTSTFGVVPFQGSRMLQFISAQNPAESTFLVDSQYYQHIDMAPMASSIALGQAVLSVSAMFNRVEGDAQTDTMFGLRVKARSGNISSYSELGSAVNFLFSDSNIATWEPLAVTGYTLPTGTTWVQLELFASENVFNDTTGVEFDGHFADAVSLNVVPEPGSALLLATVCGFAALHRRRGRPRL
jgi:hypothetical protein